MIRLILIATILILYLIIGIPGIEKQYGRAARVLCPLKECDTLLGQKDAVVLGEEAMEEALKSARIIVADPLYRPICPKDSTFYELPHVAFSGRIFI